MTAEMGDIYDGVSSLSIHDHALTRFLKAKGAVDSADIMSKDERIPIFSSGLGLDFP